MNSKEVLRFKIYQKYNGHCAYCGRPVEITAMQVDHIIPKCNFLWHIKNQFQIPEFLNHLKENDVNHIDNLNPACRVCNKWKSAHHLELFRNEIKEQINRLNKNSSNYRFAKRYGLIKETVKPIIFYFETINKLD